MSISPRTYGIEDIEGLVETINGEPFFRAVSASGKRHGLRLERDYWSMLEAIAHEEKVSLGDIIGALEENTRNAGNLTSAVRVFVARWLDGRLRGLRERMSPTAVNSLVNACPSPAFVLSATRQLRFHNPAFLRYIRMTMPSEEVEQVERRLRLQIDMNMDDLLNELRDAKRAFVTMGFAIGINDRRVRGRLNAVLAPSWSEDMIIGYVIT
ncbi:ribbon-helix-helix domain-containing protein [Oricola thermophila]|uniref:Ribbon-helix-helix domain-containing protein n=1 Tax=Oricola thermophila TaxID=2742145 RepID=A0A6N1V7Y5_9HYPH|nr:ribbon-helix-helix domain-containing protein [Oricola thermophila]QKV16984.1 ribbon-helix-helix domain-containing protein [Oricola thermophila]